MTPALDLATVAQRAGEAASAAGVPGTEVRDLEALPGGHSGLTMSATLAPPDADTRRIVVKIAPSGRPSVGRHDVLRQARVLDGITATGSTVAVPEVLFVAPGDPPLFAMAWVDGEAVEPVLDDVDVPPGIAQERALGAARMLGALHDLSLAAAGVDRDEPVLSNADELDRWARTMDAVDPALRPRGSELLRKLRQRLPEQKAPVILHGDFRLGNILCSGTELRAIIDWEIWSVGDPRIDLGWFMVFTSPDHFPGASYPAPGMPSEAALLREYEAGRGIVDEWPWFSVFGRFKMAAIMGHNLRRHREGRHHDPYQENLPPTILSLVDQGLEILSRP